MLFEQLLKSLVEALVHEPTGICHVFSVHWSASTVNRPAVAVALDHVVTVQDTLTGQGSITGDHPGTPNPASLSRRRKIGERGLTGGQRSAQFPEPVHLPRPVARERRC